MPSFTSPSLAKTFIQVQETVRLVRVHHPAALETVFCRIQSDGELNADAVKKKCEQFQKHVQLDARVRVMGRRA